MDIAAEIKALVDNWLQKNPTLSRKHLVGSDYLNVSATLLSQWTTGNEPISDHLLAKLVELTVDGSQQMKEAELLRLLLLLTKERVTKASDDAKASRWTSSSSALMQGAANLGIELVTAASRVTAKVSGRTLRDFPGSFYPLVVVSGDKREDSASRITLGDFGAVSASHAEFRWLNALGLRPDVELYSDKVFVVEDVDELRERFGKKHLLVVGSPGSNHLARRILLDPPLKEWSRAASLFRFNVPQHALREIERLLEPLRGLKAIQLAGNRADESTERAMRNWLRYLFTGGILDPTHENFWIRGLEVPQNRDYGLISLARNPFSHPNDPYLCIMVAGFHLFGTAHALRMLAKPAQSFADHPLGGVIKVSIDSGLAFAKRFDESTAEWEDLSGYSIDQLRDRLKKMKVELPPMVHITRDELDACLDFLDQL
jgi:hypothetical protein